MITKHKKSQTRFNIPALNKALLLLILTVSIAGCSSVTIRPEGGDKDSSPPSYIDSKPFYFFGFKGHHKIDVNEVCNGNDVLQMQTIETASDFILGTITLFIYSPRTVKVWCAKE